MKKAFFPHCARWLSLQLWHFCRTMIFLNIAGAAYGQATVVKDINTDPGYIAPAKFCQCGANVYFAVQDFAGNELWKTDGTAAGTRMVTDLAPGSAPGLYNSEFVCLDGQLLFSGRMGGKGFELMKTDGTESGTVLVKDIVPDWRGSSPSGFTVFNGHAYFFTNHPETLALQLWTTDGTDSGTTLVRVFGTAFASLWGSPETGADAFYFLFSNASGKEELWRSDGSPSGTLLLKVSPWMYEFEWADGKIYYAEAKDNDIRYVWAGNGLPGDSAVVMQFPFSFPQRFLAAPNGLVFDTNDEVYFTDGTPAGTVLLFTGNVYAGAAYQDKFYGVGREGYTTFLFSTTGTAEGTVRQVDLAGASHPYLMFGEIPVFNNRLLLGSADDTHGHELSISDGSPGGTFLLKDINPSGDSAPGTFSVVGDKVFFLADDGVHGRELWTTDGTGPGTALLKDINAGTQSSTYGPGVIIPLNGHLFFQASEQYPLPRDLYRSEGTEQGTDLYFDFKGYAHYLGRVGEELIFFDAGRMLKTNGEPGGTQVLKDFSPLIGGGGYTFGFSNAFELGGKLLFYFSTKTGSASLNYGGECWVSDGTDAGTFVLKDIKPGSEGSMSGLTGAALGAKLIFAADDGASGPELWITDGTTAGTALLKDIRDGSAGSGPALFSMLGGKVYFVADDGSQGVALWQTDGTALGTVPVVALGLAGSSAALPVWAAATDGLMLFEAFDETHGWTLWRSDGSPGGTAMVRDIHPGNGLLDRMRDFTAVGDKVYFAASDGVHGNELWISDGSAEGTYSIDLVPGQGDSNPKTFTLAGDRVLFSAAGKLWMTDGTDEGTAVVDDSDPMSNFVYQDGFIYFQGVTPEYGAELLKLPLPDLPTGVGKESMVRVEIYPNPATDAVRVLSTMQGESAIDITDMQGRRMSFFVLPGGTALDVPVHHYEPGLYILRIASSGGKATLKFVKR